MEVSKITTVSGHLTSTNKIHIRAMFKVGVNTAKVNRINYDIDIESPINGVYKVDIVKKNNYIMIDEKIEISKATFKIKN